MSLFAVTREAGPSWTDGKGAFEQPEVNDHAAFMNDLADDGFGCSPAPSRAANTTESECFSSPTPAAKPTSTGASPTTPGNARNEWSPQASSRGSSSAAQTASAHSQVLSKPERQPPRANARGSATETRSVRQRQR